MSILRTLNAVGTALAGAVGAADGVTPPADPRVVRELLADVGLAPGGATREDLAWAVRRFQKRCGLVADGVAGAKTVHMLARYAHDAREIRDLGLAA